MPVKKEYVQKIVAVLLSEGKDSVLKQFDLNEETFNRYMRKAKEFGISTVDRGKIIAQIIKNYTDKELEAIAKGGRIVPGYAKVPIISFEGERVRIGAITDTHIGSIDFHEERLYQAFDEFKKAHVDFIVHSGDVLEGMSNRLGHVYELTQIGYDQQKNYAVELFSQWTDTDIYAISGNHDRWYVKSSGANAINDIDKQIKNFYFLGHDEGEISLKGKAVLRLWHGEDGNCFEEGTEILTKEYGFIDFRELSTNMQVATMTKEGHIFEWQKPTNVTQQHYNGDMYNLKHRCFDFSVTENHGLWTMRKDYPDHWFRTTPPELMRLWKRQRFVIPNTVNGTKHEDIASYITIPRIESKNKGMDGKMNHVGQIFIMDLAELIAWYVTEGYASDKFVRISQYKEVNPENHLQICNLAQSLGVNYSIDDKGVTIHGKELSQYLINICGAGSVNKYLPDFIKEAPLSVLKTVFRVMIKGDGWLRGKSYGYKSISKRLREDLGLIALKLGYAVNYNKDQVYITVIQTNPTINNKPIKYHYSGMVYCCNVPNELIYIRKNGKCLWSHNSYALSYRLQKILESLTGGEKPNAMIVGHVHKYVDIFERHVLCTSIGCIQSQTRWMRSKRISAHPGFAIIDYWVNNSGVCKKTLDWRPFYS